MQKRKYSASTAHATRKAAHIKYPSHSASTKAYDRRELQAQHSAPTTGTYLSNRSIRFFISGSFYRPL